MLKHTDWNFNLMRLLDLRLGTWGLCALGGLPGLGFPAHGFLAFRRFGLLVLDGWNMPSGP